MTLSSTGRTYACIQGDACKEGTPLLIISPFFLKFDTREMLLKVLPYNKFQLLHIHLFAEARKLSCPTRSILSKQKISNP